jgi:uncharacterized protein YqeY
MCVLNNTRIEIIKLEQEIRYIMTLKDKINADFTSAMKQGDRDKKNFLGVIKGEIQNAESKPGFDLNETPLAIVKKMEKSLIESAEKGSSEAMIELEYLRPYLPEMMSKAQIEEAVRKIIDGGASNVGAVMGRFNSTYKGKADNKIVKDVATELLALA